MLRTTTLLVGVAALATALTVTLTAPASTPRKFSERYQGKTARQWHHIAVNRTRARNWLQTRLAAKRTELRRLQRYVRHEEYGVSYAIRLAATVYGVSERDLNVVASCESGHSPTASNGRYRGVFQEGPMFERGRFGRAGFSVWDHFANVFTAAETVSREGWKQWACRP